LDLFYLSKKIPGLIDLNFFKLSCEFQWKLNILGFFITMGTLANGNNLQAKLQLYTTVTMI